MWYRNREQLLHHVSFVQLDSTISVETTIAVCSVVLFRPAPTSLRICHPGSWLTCLVYRFRREIGAVASGGLRRRDKVTYCDAPGPNCDSLVYNEPTLVQEYCPAGATACNVPGQPGAYEVSSTTVTATLTLILSRVVVKM